MSQERSLSAVNPKNNDGFFELQPRPPPEQYNPDIVQPIPPSVTAQVVHLNTLQLVPPHVEEEAHNSNALPRDAVKKEWFEDMRGWIMVVAVLVASVTYTAGLSPPGGFWQDDLNGHKAGSAILHAKSPGRYTAFFYANTTAFMASLVIIILLMNEKFYCDQSKIVMLNISMVLDLVSLMIAYAAGCARRLAVSIYVIVLAMGVLLFVIYSARFLPYICSIAKERAPWVEDVIGRDLVASSRSSQRREREMTKSSSI